MTDTGGLSRRRFLTAAGAAGAAAVAGCSGDSLPTGDGDAEGEIDASGPVYNRISPSLTTFDPIAATDEASVAVVTQVFDALTNYPDGHPRVESLLASGYESNDDGTRFTFSLTEATFHDGSPVTAADVVYSFERLAASPNSSRASFLLDVLGVTHETTTVTEDDTEREVYEPGTLGVRAVDERTVEITLAAPFVAPLELLAFTAFSIVPEGIVGDIDGYDGRLSREAFATRQPVGAGPFTFVGWEQGTEVEVERYDDYHGTVPSLAGVHWQVIEDTDPYWAYAMNRNADTFAVPTTKYDPEKVTVEETTDDGIRLGTYGPVDNGDTLQYASRAGLTTYFIGFNTAAVPKPVRRAFAHAVNPGAIVENVFKRRGRSAFHLTPPGIFPGGADEYEAHAEEGYPYGYNESRRERAREIMAEAGYGPDDPFEITWTQYNNATWRRMGEVIRDQVTAAHIDMETESVEFSTLTARGRAGDLDVYTFGWSADYPAPSNFLNQLNPPQTVTGGDTPPVSYLNWTEESGSAAGAAADAWETLTANSGPGDAAATARDEAVLTMEEANWEDAALLTLFHPYNEAFSYDWVENPPYGSMGASKQKFNRVRLGDRDA
jgi:peptide/nickel transport system substrate-binding protein